MTTTSVYGPSRAESGSAATASSSAPRRPVVASGAQSLRLFPRVSGRRPAMAVASVVVVVTCAALFAVIYVHSSRLVAVIGVAREIAQGQIVEVTDLRQVDVSLAGGVDVVPVADASEVIGKSASVTLLAGTLLSPADVGVTKALPTGRAIVGVDLKPGMMPATGVTAGETVLVVLTTPTGTALSGGTSNATSGSSATRTAPSGQAAVIATATVIGVDNSPNDGGAGDAVVSLDVPLAQAPLVADSSAAGQAALVLVGGSS